MQNRTRYFWCKMNNRNAHRIDRKHAAGARCSVSEHMQLHAKAPASRSEFCSSRDLPALTVSLSHMFTHVRRFQKTLLLSGMGTVEPCPGRRDLTDSLLHLPGARGKGTCRICSSSATKVLHTPAHLAASHCPYRHSGRQHPSPKRQEAISTTSGLVSQDQPINTTANEANC